MKSISIASRATLNRVARLFLNQPCPICDRATPQTFCPDCDRQLVQSFQQHVQIQTANSLSITALGKYDGILKQAILAMKYRDRPDVALPLGAALAKRWQTSCTPANQTSAKQTIALPIPLHAERQKSRGYNQAERIATAFCQMSGLRHFPHGLQRVKVTQPQHALSASERAQNLAQVFQVGDTLQKELSRKNRQPARSKPAILLIDDIYTTGATARSAAATLKQMEIPVLGIAVLAKAGLD